MNWLTSVLRTTGPRVVGAAASAVAGWIFGKTHGIVQVDPDTLTRFVVETGTTMLTTYAVTHRIASSFVNPGDAAKGRVVEAEKVAADHGGTVNVSRDL